MNEILIVFTGGTFSMMIDKETGGAVPRFSGVELLDKIPQAKDFAKITCYDFGKYPGPHMTPELMFLLSKKISDLIKNGNFSGVIVTHGTDTLEETAYLLDLTLKTSMPVVVIGSMKNSSEPEWDGPQNLLDAISICMNPNCRDLGVLVCLNGEINAASEVTKIFTEQIDSFRSLDFGSLGFVQNGRVILLQII
jgi:L-asparaginase